jgi:uncharacterized membrane protein YheB (UPF0754 family)
MNIINILAGPIIGSMIGYVTNYIAVKMLFRPLHPIKIGNFRLPFTPGIFPKRKEQLAKALGKAVGNNLLTGEDIENMFLTEEMKEKVITEIGNLLCTEEYTIKNLLAAYFQQDDYVRGKTQLEKLICEKIVSGISKLDLGKIIARESGRVIKEKTQGTMLALLVNDKLIASLATPMGEKIETYIKENGREIIRPIVNKEIEILENRPIGDLVREVDIDKEQLLGMFDKIYTEFIRKKVAGFIKQFDIAGVVEQKVNDMDVLEIEELVFSVMKKELNAIVNLGALIGLLIGTLNIFI